MPCFSLAWLAQLLITAAVVAGLVAIVQLLLAKVALGEPWPTAVAIARIVVWVIVAVFIIWFCFDLLSCALGEPGLRLPRPR